MLEQIGHSLMTFSSFIAYLASAVVLTIGFIWAYVRVTPFREIDLIKTSNISAALSLSGTIVGFSIVLAVLIRYSLNLVDLFIWGVIALLIQIAAFLIIHLIFKDIKQAIEEDKISYGIILMTVGAVCGVITGSCMVP